MVKWSFGPRSKNMATSYLGVDMDKYPHVLQPDFLHVN